MVDLILETVQVINWQSIIFGPNVSGSVKKNILLMWFINYKINSNSLNLKLTFMF